MFRATGCLSWGRAANAATRRATWRPLANTEVYVDMDPQVFNSRVRRRALEWRSEQEAAFHKKVTWVCGSRWQPLLQHCAGAASHKHLDTRCMHAYAEPYIALVL